MSAPVLATPSSAPFVSTRATSPGVRSTSLKRRGSSVWQWYELHHNGRSTSPAVASTTTMYVSYPFFSACIVLNVSQQTDTKESKWDMPDELLLLLEKVEKENKPVQQATNSRMIVPNFVPGQLGSQGASVPLGGVDPSLPQSQQPLNGAAPQPARRSLPDDPFIPHNGFATLKEGEKAFTQLLRRAGIDTSWKWDQTIRATITDPLYKALNTLSEKKKCWQKGNPNVFHYSTFQSADRLFAQHPIWQQAKIESERKMIFEEYVAELKQREVQESRAVRARSVGKVVALFKELNVDVLTRWRTAYSALRDSDAWATDPELQRLPSLDVLLAFEDYARVQEREFEDCMRRETVEKACRDRKGRGAFKSLLRELVDVGRIRAKSKWKDVYPDFGDDERYLGLLGIPGSNPLEPFWDVVDSLDQKLDAKVTVVEEAIRKSNEQAEQSFEFGPNTTEEEFFAAVAAAQMHHEDSQSPDKDDLNVIYDFMHSDLVKRLESERRRAERKQRHMQDDFRYALKKLSDPIDVNASYDNAIPLMENLPEYKALEDEGRRAAFNKFIKRQKESWKEHLRELSEDGGSGMIDFGGPGGSAGFAGCVTPGLPTPLPSAAAGGGGGDVAMWGASLLAANPTISASGSASARCFQEPQRARSVPRRRRRLALAGIHSYWFSTQYS
ncbi:hypothetical protein DFH11DRAFT_1748020 [Phellopilus nigrolimitatus]|nr:hypothetical protein DFH11DRAFT_1748020 [Phellopilus nigrolimitatus]